MLIKILQIFGRIHYIPFGIRNRIIRLFYSPDIAKDFEFETKFFGLLYPGNLNSFIDWSVFFFGAFELRELQMIKKILSNIKPFYVLDIGANVGHHSLFMSQFSRKVLAVEPFFECRKQIFEKIKRNSLKNIDVCEFAFSNDISKKTYYKPSNTTTNKGTGSFIPDFNDNLVKFEDIDLVPGDKYCEEMYINDIGFIKIDVEGYELNVIKGLFNIINKYKPIVFMECCDSTKNILNDNSLIPNYLPYCYNLYIYGNDLHLKLYCGGDLYNHTLICIPDRNYK
jgi:FkbM family methyltransferase